MIFDIFFEIFKKASRGLSAADVDHYGIIMVAAKLNHSRVLVTKFHQNRSTLKGRSAGQRHTDRQTNSAENNGPSGLQSGQQTTDERTTAYSEREIITSRLCRIQRKCCHAFNLDVKSSSCPNTFREKYLSAHLLPTNITIACICECQIRHFMGR